MGKTPGKWIKALLTGRKSSKKRDSFVSSFIKTSSNKDVLVSSEAYVAASIVDSSLISQPTSGANATKEALSEKGLVSESSNDKVILSAREEETNAQAAVSFDSQDDLEKIKLKQAAIKAQAAFRGYQARCEYQRLKGIVQLQALIRGHLVRRQAVSTLYCVKGIVKFQALARGYKVRHSEIGLAVRKICKLLASSTSVLPLRLNYDHGEPNATWEWLDRWTRSQFWALLPESKTTLDSGSNEKNSSNQTVESNEGQVKRKTRKVSGAKADDGSISDSNKQKQRPKKVSTRPLHSSQENSQKEVEKSNLKKTIKHNVPDRSETANEKRKHIGRKISSQSVSDVSEQSPSVSAQKVKDLSVSKSKQSDVEQSPGQQAEDEHGNELHASPTADLPTSLNNAKDERIQGVSDDLNCGNNCISSVSPKNYQRRASLPAKFDNQDDGVQNTPRLPSYMAPTESAKARLRGQGSPRLANDLVDKNGITRRFSLSSSVNGKLGSFSPRAERLVAMSSKGIIRNDRSLSSSRDGTDKLIQPQWRR
ncbi:Protein IQ-DOMAIN 31 [Senna tora]|uniref:Protein IQ-DOMAIN 31 n=1 Tax=Senna tora TaxID=362788 RepID=A0A834STZ1_9FABA|nr:Protein IQ-DOMAIN 31 [Senna tora]